MAGLKKTFEGTVTFLGVNSSLDQDLVSSALSEVQMTFAGFAGEDHGGLTRSACSRLKNVHPQGTLLKNQRQLTVLSVEEMAETAATMGIDTGIQPEWVGANLVLSGVPSLSLLPPGSRLQFPDGGTIVVDLENAPCKFPAEIIEGHHPGKGLSYPTAAKGKRGFTAFVEREGQVSLGDHVAVYFPTQKKHPAL